MLFALRTPGAMVKVDLDGDLEDIRDAVSVAKMIQEWKLTPVWPESDVASTY